MTMLSHDTAMLLHYDNALLRLNIAFSLSSTMRSYNMAMLSLNVTMLSHYDNALLGLNIALSLSQ